MTKEVFFLFLINNGYLKYKFILLAIFGVIDNKGTNLISDICTITIDKTLTFKFKENTIEIDWYRESTPLYTPKEKIKVSKDHIVNVLNNIETTYGRLLVNQLLLIENGILHIPFKDTNWIKGGMLKDVMKDIANNEIVNDIQVHDFVNALQFVSSLTQLCVPAASERALSTDPNIPKKKKELLEKYKNRLNDPAVISNIEQELIKMDREWLRGDLSEGFYKSGKDFNVSRKRMFIMHGGEKSFIDDSKIDIIKFSLEDGWDLEELPKVANSLRDGSYGRGAATAMGGERVKKFQQTFQNSRISISDCGTQKGGDFVINQYNKKQFIGRYNMDGKELTEGDLENAVGKSITIRSPLYCLASKTDFCEVCTGIKMGDNPNIINTLTAAIGSVFMLIEMKATHGKELLTADYDIDQCIS